MEQSDKGNPRNFVNTILIVMVGQAGCLTAIIAIASVYGGLWLDNYFGTKPLFTLILLFAGIPISVLLMLFFARRTLARLKIKSESESKSTSNETSA